jgi:hypothetical protein
MPSHCRFSFRAFFGNPSSSLFSALGLGRFLVSVSMGVLTSKPVWMLDPISEESFVCVPTETEVRTSSSWREGNDCNWVFNASLSRFNTLTSICVALNSPIKLFNASSCSVNCSAHCSSPLLFSSAISRCRSLAYVSCVCASCFACSFFSFSGFSASISLPYSS